VYVQVVQVPCSPMSPDIVALNAFPPVTLVNMGLAGIPDSSIPTIWCTWMKVSVCDFFSKERYAHMRGGDATRFHEWIQALDRDTATSEPNGCVSQAYLEYDCVPLHLLGGKDDSQSV
jgi:hypothetical protein